jgi:ribulose-phosphate 3-epimerase
MKNDFQILPSILAADSGMIVEEALTVDIPEIEYLHIDVMDGHFVPNLTMGPSIVKSLKKHTRFKLDVHLMITNAPDMIGEFADAGADIITVHQEAVTHLHREIQKIKNFGVKAGVSLNPATPVESLFGILSEIDLVLIMSVNPGFGGQKFIPESNQKLHYLSMVKQERAAQFMIEVDGGIAPETAPLAYKSGARYLVAGNAIFKKKDRAQAILDIQKSIDSFKENSQTYQV